MMKLLKFPWFNYFLNGRKLKIIQNIDDYGPNENSKGTPAQSKRVYDEKLY